MRAHRHSRAWRRTWLAGALVASLVLPGRPATGAPPQEADEYTAKAALLYAFAKFVEWPDAAFADAEAPFVICVIGDDPFGPALEQLRDKRIHGRRVEVRRVDQASDSGGCQLVFCDLATYRSVLQGDPDRLSREHVLTVSEDVGFPEAGGVLRITFVDDHLGFVINAAAARRAGLQMSASLLNLATEVIGYDG